MAFRKGDIVLLPFPFPSAFKPLLFTLEPSLILHTVGKLSAEDSTEVDRRVRRALDLPFASVSDFIAKANLNAAPAAQVQTLAEQAIAAVLLQANQNTPGADPERLRMLLFGPNPERAL